ncbi:RNA-binding E3 ubiquitin-protein ligase MEX3C-like [Falco naumanni]|uniref:RNA-binding E3 ubiquitin-protein ligase MEX3C-like n=1 Tax=Falco naumanni TaxID=148594 RepID=UPI001ADE9601|nr:RNA-binding E3 ubiquitin-protein ligase MEX3C-like [Falco naumanni]
MPSGSTAAASLAAEPLRLPSRYPSLLLLQQRLAGLGLRDRGLPTAGGGEGGAARRQARRRRPGLVPLPDPPGELGPGEEEEAVGDEGDLELEEEELLAGEEDPAALLLSSPSQPLPLLPALGSVLLSPSFDAPEAAEALCGAEDPQGVMAAMLSHTYGGDLGGGGDGAAGLNGEQAALLRRKSVNTTECVPVPSSEHVAEIVGRQGCKIKALRAKTNTYIKTPVRGEEPIFVVTGRKEDVAMAKREILSAAEHFSMIRASRNKNGPALGGLPCTPNLPGQTTVQVRVPYCVVGLVVGPKGATIKRIQQQTHTYIVTPSRDKEPVFEVTGMPENVDRAREEIEMHIAMRTGNYIELNEENDFHYNGTDVSFEGGTLGSVWLASNPVPPRCTRMISNYRNDSSSSLGSGSTDSYFGSNRLADFGPTSPFSTGNFWFGEALPSVGTEDLAVDSPAYDSLPMPSQTFWTPFEPVNPLSGFGSDPASNAKPQHRGSQPSTPCLSPTFPESLDHPLASRVRSDPPSTGHQAGLPIYIPAFSNGTNSYSSSNGGSTSSSPPESRRKHDCVICFESEVIAALVPCGHNLFCMECANKICEKETPSCPVCQTAVTQAIQIHS